MTDHRFELSDEAMPEQNDLRREQVVPPTDDSHVGGHGGDDHGEPTTQTITVVPKGVFEPRDE